VSFYCNDLSADDIKPLRCMNSLKHPPLIEKAIHLGSAASHSQPLARVEVLELDRRLIGSKGHLATQGINLPNQVPLSLPPDRGIAGHPADASRNQRDEQGPSPQSRRRQGGLDASMSASDHDDVNHI